jgi:hypothetical protein
MEVKKRIKELEQENRRLRTELENAINQKKYEEVLRESVMEIREPQLLKISTI